MNISTGNKHLTTYNSDNKNSVVMVPETDIKT